MNISISRDGTEIGEWTEEEVRSFYQEGRLIDTDLYWMSGMSEWEPLSCLIRPVPPFPAKAIEVPPPFPLTISVKESKKIGIGRLEYVAWMAGWFVTAFVLAVFIDKDEVLVLGIVAIMILAAYRLKNIGYPGTYCIICLLPLANIVLFLACLFQAPNSARKKKPSK